MKAKAIEDEIKGEYYHCGNDFKILPAMEKQGILKTAKTLLKEQNKVKSLLANAVNNPSSMEAERQKRP